MSITDKQFQKERVIITLEALPEDADPREELESADDYAWVKRQQRKGNKWAWCCVKVAAMVQHPTKEGEVLVGTDYLGQCMYRSREDFIKSEYYEDMKAEAIANVQRDWESGWM